MFLAVELNVTYFGGEVLFGRSCTVQVHGRCHSMYCRYAGQARRDNFLVSFTERGPLNVPRETLRLPLELGSMTPPESIEIMCLGLGFRVPSDVYYAREHFNLYRLLQ